MPLIAFAFLACAPRESITPEKAAACAAIRAFFEDAQSKLIDSGACDTAVDIARCVPHQALEDSFIASLKEERCPSKTN